MIIRTIDPNTMARTHLRLLEDHLKPVKYHNYTKKLLSICRNFCIIKIMDLVTIHLRERLGIREVPLSYMIGENSQLDPVEAQVVNKLNGESYYTIVE